MNILSLFDGMSCGLVAFTELGIPVDRYIAYEIDRYAIRTSKHNFPNVEQMGDVFDADFSVYEGFDVLIGGSPCTYWSIAQSVDKREKTASGIGWELFSQYVRALNEAKPKFFLYENNKSMSKEIRASITEAFGFEPICINSALVSAQNRQRLYWVGQRAADGTYCKVDVQQPQDKSILLKDVLDGVTDREKGRAIIGSAGRTTTREYFNKSQGNMAYEPVIYQVPHGFNDGGIKYGKSPTLTTNGSWQNNNFIAEPVVECVSSRGVYCDTGSRSKKSEAGTEQHFEVRGEGKTNALTTVQKDNMVAVGVSMQVMGRKRQGDGSFVRVPEARVDGKTTALTSVEARRLVAVQVGTLPKLNGELSTSMGARIHSPEVNATVYKVENGLIEINNRKYPIKLKNGYYTMRKLTVNECKRLQTVPDWFEFPVSNTQAYKMLGNGWTVSVIMHLLSSILKEENKNAEEH